MQRLLCLRVLRRRLRPRLAWARLRLYASTFMIQLIDGANCVTHPTWHGYGLSLELSTRSKVHTPLKYIDKIHDTT